MAFTLRIETTPFEFRRHVQCHGISGALKRLNNFLLFMSKSGEINGALAELMTLNGKL